MQKLIQKLFKKNAVANPYAVAISAIKSQINRMDDVGQKITLLEFTRKSIISELAMSRINGLLYYGQRKEWIDNRFPFQLYSMNRECYYELLDEKHECDLSKNMVVSQPWNIDRYFNAFLTIAEDGFRYDKLNHMISYFPQLDLYMAYNGLHSISAGVVSQIGTLPCIEVYDLTKMFDNVHTDDGISWVDAAGQVINRIPDFRFGLIFEISRLIRDLEVV